MTLQEIIDQLASLSVAERRALRDAVDRSLAGAELPPAERIERAQDFGDLAGILASDKPIPPDWDWKEEYIDYLLKKYS